MNKYVYVYYVYIYIHILEYINTSLPKKDQTIEKKHVCVDVCMDIWMEKSQTNRVLNKKCTQLRMHRCKIYVVVFLGEPNTPGVF